MPKPSNPYAVSKDSLKSTIKNHLVTSNYNTKSVIK